MPLSVIRGVFERQDQGKNATRNFTTTITQRPRKPPTSALPLSVGNADAIVVRIDDQRIVEKFHSIDRMPDLVGASVGFVRQLRSWRNHASNAFAPWQIFVDGRDAYSSGLTSCAILIWSPKLASVCHGRNRESRMFAKSLVVCKRVEELK